jgi:hypothetical protein
MGREPDAAQRINPGSLARINSSIPVVSYKHPGPGPGPKHWEPSILLQPKEPLLVIEVKDSFSQVFGSNGFGWLLTDSLKVINEKR